MAQFTLDERGTIAISETAGGRELVTASPLFSVRDRDGSRYEPTAASLDRATKRLVFRLGENGTATFSVRRGEGAWLFTCESLSVAGFTPERATFGPLETPLETYRGYVANMLSDDHFGVCVRAASWEEQTCLTAHGLAVNVSAERLRGPWSVGVVAAPRDKLATALQAMTKLCGVPVSTAGGAWALASPIADTSYVFADDIRLDTVDRWVDFAQQAGIAVLHFHGWWQTLGHYAPNRRIFPGGLPDMKATADRIHAAGLLTGMHTLSSNIQVPADPWISAGAHVADFIATRSYTLAEPLSAGEKNRLVIREMPAGEQDAVLTYSGNGNVLRLGNELVRYTGIERDEPYGFTGLERGWAGTTPSSHPAGSSADWLRQRYVALYPKLGSSMLRDLAAALGAARDAIGADMFYFDGMEGCGLRRDMDGTRFAIFRQLHASPLTESSAPTPGTWWFQSRLGTWDRPIWNMKRFTDNHVSDLAETMKANLLRGQMGWWAPRTADASGSGHFWNDMEYFAARSASIDAVMSLQGVAPDRSPLAYDTWRQVTILGWYERMRRAKAFTPKALSLLRSPNWEFRLRQDDATGVWKLFPMRSERFKWTGLSDTPPNWTFAAPGRTRGIIRIEALYNAHAHSVSQGTLVSATPMMDMMDWRGRNMKIPRNCAFLLKVIGNGGSQRLHMRACADRAYLGGISDQFAPLDFRGEKIVVLPIRERDETDTKAYAAYGISLDTDHIASADVRIEGDDAEAVKVGGLWAVPLDTDTLHHPAVTIGETAFEAPFDLQSGDYAELEDGVWTHFRKGEIVAVAKSSQGSPSFDKGENAVRFSIVSPQPVRAEVTLFAHAAKGLDALRGDLDDAAKALIACEPMEPIRCAPSCGTLTPPSLKVRPGERAWLSFALSGDAVQPRVKVGSDEAAFAATLHSGEMLLCPDGLNWQITDAACRPVRKGKLHKRITGVTGVKPVTVSAGGRLGGLTVRIIKHYQTTK